VASIKSILEGLLAKPKTRGDIDRIDPEEKHEMMSWNSSPHETSDTTLIGIFNYSKGNNKAVCAWDSSYTYSNSSLCLTSSQSTLLAEALDKIP